MAYSQQGGYQKRGNFNGGGRNTGTPRQAKGNPTTTYVATCYPNQNNTFWAGKGFYIIPTKDGKGFNIKVKNECINMTVEEIVKASDEATEKYKQQNNRNNQQRPPQRPTRNMRNEPADIDADSFEDEEGTTPF